MKTKARILVVEDENTVAAEITDKLRELGYSVSAVAATGEEALNRAKETQPDLVLFDIRLRDKENGADAAGKIRTRLNIPVVYLNPNGADGSRQQNESSIPRGHLYKTFVEQELHTTIESVLCEQTIERKLIERERWLATTLKSISEAVITTDIRGRVTFINPVAEKLTGWERSDVLGKDLAEIYQIKSNDTLLPESRNPNRPGERDIIAPAKETILVARDGSERPISDSAAPIQDDQGKVIGVVLIFSDITQRKRTEDAIRAQRDLALALSEEFHLDEGLRLCLDMALKVSGMDSGGVYLVDEASGDLLLVLDRGLSPEFVQEVSRYPADSSNARMVMAGNTMYASYLEIKVNLLEVEKNEGLIALAVLPIHHEGRVIGCLNIASHTLAQVPEYARDALEIIAAQVGSAIARLRAEESLERKAAQQEQLLGIARNLTESLEVKEVLTRVGTGAREMLQTHGCIIYLLNGDGTTLYPVVAIDPSYEKEIMSTPLDMEHSFTGKAVRAGRGLIFNDTNTGEGQQVPGTPEQNNERIIATPFVVDGEVLGAMCLNRLGTLFTEEDLALAETFATYAATALKNAQTHQDLQREVGERRKAERGLKESFLKVQRILEETVHVLTSAVEIRDPYTAGHQRRVTVLACAIAGELGLPKDKIEGLRMAALIHDIGKIYIPAEILSKPGRLTETQRRLIQTHPQVGHDVLKNVEFPWPVARIVLEHHERLNGSGFPQGLSGEDILIEAKIMAVADVVEAMSSHRPYRPAHGINKAMEEISQNKGKFYDPKAVDACIQLFWKKSFKFDE